MVQHSGREEGHMTDEIVFHHNPMSRGRIVHLMLEEVGAPYRIELRSFEKRDHKSPEYLAINPMGKIPAIEHRGMVVTEAAAICAYLADAFPEARLAPALDDPARGTYLRWLFFAAACLEPALVDRMLNRPPADEAGRVGYGTYEKTLDVLEGALTPGPFLLGDRFSAADVFIGSHIGFGFRANSLEPRPVFVAYYARIGERPAFKRMVAQNVELVAKLKR
jgi:glutathione S-transferase